MKFTSLPRAFVRESNERITQNFSLDKFVKSALRRLNVSFFDPCCGVSAINSSAVATPSQIEGGLITSTSLALTTITLPTAADLGDKIGAEEGAAIDFIINNRAGTSTITLAVNTGISVIDPIITGSNTMTVAVGDLGQFRIIYDTATTARVARVV